VVVSAQGKISLIKNVTIEGEYAESVLTQNSNDINTSPSFSSLGSINGLINTNASTEQFSAYKTTVTYQQKKYSIGANYERVDPGYRTLGGYFFNNDIENYSISPTASLFKGKVNLALNTGLQRNNLAENNANTTKRWIGSLNLSIIATKKLTLSGSYSNFSTFTRGRPNNDPFFTLTDTLDFYQITQNVAGIATYRFGDKDVAKNLLLRYNYNQNTNLAGNLENQSLFGFGISDQEATNIQVHATNASYSINYVPINFSVIINTNYNLTQAFENNITFYGGGVTLQKTLKNKKTTLSAGSLYNLNNENGVLVGNVFNHRLSASYTPEIKNEKLGKVTFSLNGVFLQRLANATTTSINELTIFATINYSF